MLSVLIPTYGYDASELARVLHSQLKASGIPFELICMDNGSGSETNKLNEGINQLENCRFEALKQDGGRSRIRNKLTAEAKYPWLLFLDSDVLPVHEDFIQNYLKIIGSNHLIAFGGLEYQKEPPDDKSLLRWVYGKKREAVPLIKRQKDPVRSFTSANFLASKKLMESHPFDESLLEYGFEDALLAIELDREGINILHLDNPVYHLGLETSEIFLSKTRRAVENLWLLHQKGLIGPEDSDLLNWSEKLDQFGVRYISSKVFRALKNFLEGNLTSRHPSMLIYDIYRLGYISGLKKDHQSTEA